MPIDGIASAIIPSVLCVTLLVTPAAVRRWFGSSASHVADDVSDGDGTTQRDERTRSDGRERGIGKLDSPLPHVCRHLSNPIRRMTDRVRRMIYGNVQGVAYLADAGKRLVGERIDDLVRRAGGAVDGSIDGVAK